MRKILLMVSIVLCIKACEENIDNSQFEDLLTGEWSHLASADTLTTLTKVRSLSGEEYGITFLESGDLKEIKNSGWCGTPPISYGEFGGSWVIDADSTLRIESTYWGGAMSMTWKIISIDSHQITYYLEDYYFDYNE